MRRQSRILIAFLLFISFANTALPQSDSDPNVVFSLKEQAVWAPVLGVEGPAFTLYDNRDLIYFNMNTWGYEYIKLTESEYARLIEEVIPKDLQALEHYYRRGYITDQNEYYFYFGGESQRMVTVYGHPTTTDEWLSFFNIPQSLRRCFNTLTGYFNQWAVPWYRMPIPGEEVFDQQFEEPDYENTPLHDALSSDRINEAKSLLAQSVDVNVQRADGKTPLHLAVEKGYKSITELLIANGADIEARTLYGNTPLLCALDFLQADMAELLLENGADVNAANSMGDTALHYTTDDRLTDVIKQLIAAGLDVNIRNDANDTPLICAARDGAMSIVILLLAEGADINAAKSDGRTALHVAAFHNHIEIVDLLIAKRADVNVKTTEGHTPLDFALMAGHDDIAALLQAAVDTEGKILFRFEADDEIKSTPAIGEDGTIYFGTQNATLYAVDPNGNLKWTWRYETAGWGPLAFEAAPVIAEDGTIYVADDIAIPNYLFAISPQGERKWEWGTSVVYGSMDASPVLLSDGTIFAGGYGFSFPRLFGQVVALAPDGTVLDGFPIHTGAVIASPVVVDDVVIVGETAWRSGRNKVFAVTKSADILWRTELYGDVDGSRAFSLSSLAVDNYNNIFVANNCEDYYPETGPPTVTGAVIQLHPLTGENFFEMMIPTQSIVVGSPVIDAAEFGANIIVATQNAHVISLNPYTDGEKLNYDLVLGENSEAAGTPVIGDNGKLYHAVNSFGDVNQIEVFEINADGTINDDFVVRILNDQVSSSLTMDNNGVLYFGTKEGKLYAVQTEANSLSSEAPWPTFRHDTRNTGNSGLNSQR